LRAWAQGLTRKLQEGWSQLEYKNAASSAKNDGAILWDATTETVQVSDDGAFRSLAYVDESATLGPFFINDLPGTATTEALIQFFNTGTAVNLVSGGVRMPRVGRVVAIYMVSDANRTAGTATARVVINGAGTAFDGGSVVLDGTNVNRDSGVVAYSSGVSFVAGNDVALEVVTSGWTPTTANITLWMTVRFEPF
jgi:hypothetical protein